ncbi:DUF434 domain-containing protein [Anaerocolumna sp. AGMB13020]|uniref:DUF434 domain-containing protein n=1 Tax=Anaerocolumna sp. AGMB13020 TaxID=3081750 RepID=UPI002952ED7B|nr:DUF434 domain-containing protein [Anaerocolumna sp. AGMB13020]WOO35639.1 DUF434 domain-containing protein [Anaerocolumna sp. AGMB13020]
MTKQTRRGYKDSDEKEFGAEAFNRLTSAGKDIRYLINQGYPVSGASVFVGNHYLLSERQRMALLRWAATEEAINLRKSREIYDLRDRILHIDGFNILITLEVILSGSPVFRCLDGTIRDLAGLRGTYHPIDKTITALRWLGDFFEKKGVKEIIFYLDAPVSNSGRLKVLIQEELEPFSFRTQVFVTNEVDKILKTKECVATSDSIILDYASNWVNLNSLVLSGTSNLWMVDFLNGDPGEM